MSQRDRVLKILAAALTGLLTGIMLSLVLIGLVNFGLIPLPEDLGLVLILSALVVPIVVFPLRQFRGLGSRPLDEK